MNASEDQQRRGSGPDRAAGAGAQDEPAATAHLDPKAFRRQLDAILRQRDPVALRAFLVAQGQWAPDTATDPERAMWMMIAASPALAQMHGEAERWLTSHGHTEEAQAILGQGQAKPGGQRRPRASGAHRGNTKHGGPHREGGSGGSGKPQARE